MAAKSATLAPELFELDPERDIRNVPGAPGWFELATPDPESAQNVLTKLFGWTFDALDSTEAGTPYFVAKVAGHEVGGVRQPMPGEPDTPRWVTYLTVADVDDVATRAEETGASVVVPPTQLGAAGRMTVVDSSTTGHLYAFEYGRRFA
jgi:predicted enzyme related to lactoylglutathione lyase